MSRPVDLHAEARAWIDDDPDPLTRAELRGVLAAGDDGALAERFAGRLRFGTAGLRGELRAGPMGMNRVVVGLAAGGLAAYLSRRGAVGPVVIGYDARHRSARFARDTAEIIAGAGLDARLFPRALPTPVLAFAVRSMGASAGVMVTASHNPPRDNGYKVYLGGDMSDCAAGGGAQIVPPADADIEAATLAIPRLAGLPRAATWMPVSDRVADDYVAATAALPRGDARDLTVAYTPLHGVGADVVRSVFTAAGFPAPHVVAEQAAPDPDFPTVPFPNPEEPGALDLALALAERVGADIVIANDPDADRCAVACRGRALTGDQLGALLADHLIRTGTTGRYATTIVSSSLLGAICAERGLPYAETLTGFKWIVRAGDDVSFGYEEALGYCCAPDQVRDKDGISAAILVADLAATLKAAGQTLLDRLDEISRRYGVHASAQLSIRVTDLREIATMMRRLRADPPSTLAGHPVSTVDDLLPETDAVRLRAGPIRVVVRPSGTEPKLKAYLQVIEPVTGPVHEAEARAARRLDVTRDELARALAP
ncbi:MAG: phosphomannomutase [Pseudonocardiales bacterium]|nr:MAG: phosphomannomutase [Pseudonocardiales bacterium]PZS29160.1 MAG: phosphomannomutase [Pseudonocardiales bacterium]